MRAKANVKIGRYRTPVLSENIPSSSRPNIDRRPWLERTDHPLMHNLILEILFQYVKPNDLKTCRLVCKKWNISSLPFIRSTFQVIILGKNSGVLPADTCRIEEFMELFGSNRLGCPFTKFMLGSFNPTIGIGRRFLQLYGEKATKFDFWRTEETHAVENVSVFLKSAPKLESFKMPICLRSKRHGNVVKLFPDGVIPELKFLKTFDLGLECDDGTRTDCCPTFYEEFLKAAQNISTIFACHTLEESGGILEVLNLFEKLGRESSLQILSLNIVGQDHVDILRKMVMKPRKGLKLKHLSLLFGQISENDTCWFELIELMKDTLVSLHIQNNHILNFLKFHYLNFPQMSQLKLLELSFWKCNFEEAEETREECPMWLNNLSRSLPALEFLRLTSEHRLHLNEIYLGTDPEEYSPTLKSLILRNLIVNLRTFERTLNIFPNLNELEMCISDNGESIFKKIWTQMSGLEKLNIYGKLTVWNIIDSLVTGISSEGLKRFEELKLETLTKEVRRNTILKFIEEHGSLPSIRNLTHLRHLTLNVAAEGPRSHRISCLTNVTGYLGLHSMRNLRRLNISDCKFSKNCCEILVAEMNLESWIIQSEAETDIIPPKWYSEKSNNERDFPRPPFFFNYAF